MLQPPLPSENIPGTHFCYRLCHSQGHSAAGRIIYVNEKFRLVGQCLNQLHDRVPRLSEELGAFTFNVQG
jgi:hypothetical protein